MRCYTRCNSLRTFGMRTTRFCLSVLSFCVSCCATCKAKCTLRMCTSSIGIGLFSLCVRGTTCRCTGITLCMRVCTSYIIIFSKSVVAPTISSNATTSFCVRCFALCNALIAFHMVIWFASFCLIARCETMISCRFCFCTNSYTLFAISFAIQAHSNCICALYFAFSADDKRV